MRSSRRPLRRARPCRTPRLAAFVAVAVAVVAAAVALAPPPARAGDGETFVLITTNQGGVLRFGLDGAPQGCSPRRAGRSRCRRASPSGRTAGST